MAINIILCAILGCLSNWLLKGGGIESILLTPKRESRAVQALIRWRICNIQDDQVSMRGLKIINALIYGVMACIFSSCWAIGGLLFIAMLAVAGIALGSFIKAMLGESTDHDEAWGYARMTVRGLMWGAGVCAAAALGAYISGVPLLTLKAFYGWTMAVGATQGAVTLLLIDLKRSGRLYETVAFNAWTGQEMINGSSFWATLPFLAAVAKYLGG